MEVEMYLSVLMSVNICLVVALVNLCLSWQTAKVCKHWISSNWPMHAVAGHVCGKWLMFSQMQRHKSFSVMEFATSNVDLKPPRVVNLWGHILWMFGPEFLTGQRRHWPDLVAPGQMRWKGSSALEAVSGGRRPFHTASLCWDPLGLVAGG